MSVAAFAEVSLVELREKVGVAKQADVPKHLDTAMKALEVFVALAKEWDRLSESHRDLLRYLANELRQPKASWWRRQRAGFQFWLHVSRLGVEQTVRLASRIVSLVEEFIAVVDSFEERQNAPLQEELGAAVSASLAPSSRKALTREQVGDYFKRLPS